MGRAETRVIVLSSPFGNKNTDLHPSIIPELDFTYTENMLIQDGKITHGKANYPLNPNLSGNTIKTGGVVLKNGEPVIIIGLSNNNVMKYENGTWTTLTGTATFDNTNQNVDLVEGFKHFYNKNVAFGICNSTLYRFDLDSNTVNTQITNPVEGNFTFNSGKSVAIYANFLFVGNVNETPSGGSATDYPQRLRWSRYNRPDLWANNPDGTGQAGYLDFASNTYIIGLTTYGDFLYIFTNQGIYALEYVGGALIHKVRQVITEDEAGVVISPQAFIVIEDNLFFATQNDIYILRGKNYQPILSKAKIRGEYIGDIKSSRAKFSSFTYDKLNNVVKFNIPIDNTQTKVYIIDMRNGNVYTDVYMSDLKGVYNYIAQTPTTFYSDEIAIRSDNVYRFVEYSSSYTTRFGQTQNMRFETKLFGGVEFNQAKRVKGIEIIGEASSVSTAYISCTVLFSNDGGNSFNSSVGVSFDLNYLTKFALRANVNRISKYYKLRFGFNPAFYWDKKPRISMIKIYEEALQGIAF